MSQPSTDQAKDRSRWAIPIAVALIAALATIVAAVLPGLIGRDEPPVDEVTPAVANGSPSGNPAPTESMTPPKFHTMLYAGDGTNVDLADSNDTLVDVAISDGPLRSRNQSVLAVLTQGRPESRATCLEHLGSAAVSELAVSAMSQGTRLCLKTSAGRVAILLIEAVTPAVGDETRLYSLSFTARLF